MGIMKLSNEQVKFFFSVKRKRTTELVHWTSVEQTNLLREHSLEYPWEFEFEGLGVHECWSVFRKYFLEPWEQAIPQCLKSNNRGRRPAWHNGELLMVLKGKMKLHDLWK